MMDLCDQTFLLNQLPHSELERAEESIFRELERAHNKRDLRLTEILSTQLSELCRYMRKRAVGQSGQAILELAMTLPILALLLVGAIDVCAGITDKNTLNSAAASAALFGSVNMDPRPTYAQIEDLGRQNCAALVLARDVVFSITSTGASAGDELTVTASANANWIMLPSGTIRAVAHARLQ
jgi:hypothetical protein